MKKILVTFFSAATISASLWSLTAASTDAGSIMMNDSYDPIEYKILVESAGEGQKDITASAPGVNDGELSAENQYPEPDGDVYPEPSKINLNIPGLNHELTQKYIELYQSKENSSWLAQSLVNSAPYRPYIRQKLAEKNMPSYLQYLPVIESNYKITAVSKSGAKGMWQFMDNSMAPLLKKSSWYDQRYDPWLETDAALIKLMDNYKMFGDWNLAIAAYNCGGGAMRRLLKAHPKADFWYLAEHNHLRTETKLYVPKLLAVAELVENAEYYGLINVGVADKMIEFTEIEEFDYVKMSGVLTMEQLSQIVDVNVETLKFLNPSLLKGMTPPEQFEIRLPHGKGEAAEAALRKADIPGNTLNYTVQKGDNLSVISRKFDVTIDEICKINQISRDSILSIGQVLTIPVYDPE